MLQMCGHANIKNRLSINCTHDSVKVKNIPRMTIPTSGPPAVPNMVKEICTSESPKSTKDSPIQTPPNTTATKRNLPIKTQKMHFMILASQFNSTHTTAIYGGLIWLTLAVSAIKA